MTDVLAWDVTAANNNSAAPDGFAENMAPSGVNDAAREVMAAIKRYQNDTDGTNSSTGSSNAYVLAASQTISAYAAGQRFTFKANHANTGAATLNVDSVGAKGIKKRHDSALASGDIQANQIVEVVYNATDDTFELISSTYNEQGESNTTIAAKTGDYTLVAGDLSSFTVIPIDISSGSVAITELAIGSMSGIVCYTVSADGGSSAGAPNEATLKASGGTVIWSGLAEGDHLIASYASAKRIALSHDETYVLKAYLNADESIAQGAREQLRSWSIHADSWGGTDLFSTSTDQVTCPFNCIAEIHYVIQTASAQRIAASINVEGVNRLSQGTGTAGNNYTSTVTWSAIEELESADTITPYAYNLDTDSGAESAEGNAAASGTRLSIRFRRRM